MTIYVLICLTIYIIILYVLKSMLRQSGKFLIFKLKCIQPNNISVKIFNTGLNIQTKSTNQQRSLTKKSTSFCFGSKYAGIQGIVIISI